MKQLLTKTITTILLALAIAPSLNAYPASVCKLQEGDVTIALIGDRHSAWLKEISSEPPYIKAIQAWLAQLKDKKTATHFMVELEPSKDAQTFALKFNSSPEACDSLGFLQYFALNNNFTSGTIKFIAADERTGAMRIAPNLLSTIVVNKELCKNGFPNVATLRAKYGKITLNDFLQQCDGMYAQLLNTAKKFTFSAAAAQEIETIKAIYDKNMGILKAMFAPAIKEGVVHYLHNMCAQSQGMMIPAFTKLYFDGMIPVLGALGDLHFAFDLLEAAQHHKHIVAYLGRNHVAHAVVILQGAGFKLVEQPLGNIKHGTPSEPLNLEAFKKALAHTFNDSATGEESKEVKVETAAKEEGKAAQTSAGSAASTGAGAESTEPTKPATCNNPACTTQTTKLLDCGRCRQAKYCSAACQRAHWPTHKPGCKKA